MDNKKISEMFLNVILEIGEEKPGQQEGGLKKLKRSWIKLQPTIGRKSVGRKK